jgi:hypothetical protein
MCVHLLGTTKFCSTKHVAIKAIDVIAAGQASDSQAALRCALLFGNYLLTSFDNDQGVPSVPVSKMASFEGSKSCPSDLPEKNLWAQSQSWA